MLLDDDDDDGDGNGDDDDDDDDDSVACCYTIPLCLRTDRSVRSVRSLLHIVRPRCLH